MKHKHTLAVLGLLIGCAVGLRADSDASLDDSNGLSSTILNRYLQATNQADSAPATPQEIEIVASVPKLHQHGTLRVLRKISEVGKITYRVLGFQGDNTVKNQVIARYLQAEQQGSNDNNLKLTPANYKFRLKSPKSTVSQGIYVFQVAPRSKRVGLYKGELWLDAKTYLPVVEKGRLVKNPSIFFRKVDFERDFAILNGAAVPAHMSSTIDTRVIGKVNLSVAYSNPVSSDSENTANIVPASF